MRAKCMNSCAINHSSIALDSLDHHISKIFTAWLGRNVCELFRILQYCYIHVQFIPLVDANELTH